MAVRQGWLFTTSAKATIDTSATSPHTKIITLCALFGLDSSICPLPGTTQILASELIEYGELCSVGLYGYNPSKACKHA